MQATSKTILFISGSFISHYSWNNWRVFFEENGYITNAPAWPYRNDSAEILRKRHPDADIASITLLQLLDYYEGIANSFPEQPVLIGHSLGGLIVQVLLNRGVGAAGIVINSVPPRGVMTFTFSYLSFIVRHLGFLTSIKTTYLLSFSGWRHFVTNGMPIADQKKSYNTMAVPESRLVARDCFSRTAKIDFKKAHVPLLFVAGNEDWIIPASLNYFNYKKYSHKKSVTAYKEFKKNNHFVFTKPSEMAITTYIQIWLLNLHIN
ncbi:MAG: alpha/beta hydrolase [Bacteroidota bacterium]